MILLDTDVVSTVMRDQLGVVAGRVARVPLQERFTTAITVGELLYGMERAPHQGRVRQLFEAEVLPALTVLPFDTAAARHYARIRAGLERDGQPLGEPDLRIAAIALAHDLTLISGHVRHFARVPGLKVENWME